MDYLQEAKDDVETSVEDFEIDCRESAMWWMQRAQTCALIALVEELRQLQGNVNNIELVLGSWDAHGFPPS